MSMFCMKKLFSEAKSRIQWNEEKRNIEKLSVKKKACETLILKKAYSENES